MLAGLEVPPAVGLDYEMAAVLGDLRPGRDGVVDAPPGIRRSILMTRAAIKLARTVRISFNSAEPLSSHPLAAPVYTNVPAELLNRRERNRGVLAYLQANRARASRRSTGADRGRRT
ncbi:hypothetical protein Nm8I071_56920 [Nonomuraea sp. TT08I-71]|nr:hypothetical protein Nm8I071_56920 [Nonomuraea sp. TT08I-71]